jgi:hypothetical protein
MMTIDEEIQALITFLSHPAGFNVDWGGLICIRPISEDSPPTDWAVNWRETADGIVYDCEKGFSSLKEAAECFVEKRRYLLYGLDFEQILVSGESVHAEIENE